jgi:hypothetical protein
MVASLAVGVAALVAVRVGFATATSAMLSIGVAISIVVVVVAICSPMVAIVGRIVFVVAHLALFAGVAQAVTARSGLRLRDQQAERKGNKNEESDAAHEMAPPGTR